MTDNEFIAGLFSGITQVIVGHPLDTIKVNKQNNIKINSRLYQGITYPLISNSLIVGLQFDLYYRYNAIIDGIITSMILTPLDYYKINKQNNNNISFSKMIKNMPKSYPITCLRESLALSIYFGGYDMMRKKNYNPLVAGGLAGVASWLFTFPIDTIKTRIQSGSNFKQALKERNFWKGINITLGRALIVNSLGFYVAEHIKKNI